jgi:hypothetical protein
MKFIVRWAFRLLILLIVLAVALVLLKDTIIRAFAQSAIRTETGLEAKIDTFRVGLLAPTITIENFTLYNSPDFGGSPFVVIPELHVEYDREAAALGRLHLTLVRFDLARLNIVQDRAGRLNYQELEARLQKEAAGQKAKPALKFTGIDTLNLSLGTVKFTDLRSSGKSWEHNLGVQNEIISNVKSSADLTGMLLKLMVRRGINLAGGAESTQISHEPSRSVAPATRRRLGDLTGPFKR